MQKTTDELSHKQFQKRDRFAFLQYSKDYETQSEYATKKIVHLNILKIL